MQEKEKSLIETSRKKCGRETEKIPNPKKNKNKKEGKNKITTTTIQHTDVRDIERKKREIGKQQNRVLLSVAPSIFIGRIQVVGGKNGGIRERKKKG